MTRLQSLVTFTTTICFVISGSWFGSVMGSRALSTLDVPLRGAKVTTAAEVVQGILARVHVKDIPSSSVGYLLIGVDRAISPPKLALQSIWAVIFTPDYSAVELLGLAPTRELQNALSEGSDHFTTVVSAQLSVPIRKQFVLDSGQFKWIIDTLGGVRLSGAVLDGENTLDYVRAGRDLDEQLLRQAAAVQSLVAQVVVLGNHTDVSAVLDKIRPGVLSQEEMSAINDNFSPLRIERVRVRAVTEDTHPVTALKPYE